MADDLADPACTDHPEDLAKTCPLDSIGLPGQQYDVLDGNAALQAVEIVEGILIPVGIQQFEFLFGSPDAGLFKKLPGDGLTAGLPCLGRAAGIFPGTGKALSLCPAGQQNVSVSVIDPNAYHKTVLSRAPGGAPQMYFPGQIPVFVVDIIVFHPVSPFQKIPSTSIAQL